jgi:predicted nucleotidyltransferase|tara:strand:+ start:1469 stop:1984 length:516 start_codon:yes stop_codon:yes gene_type:complete
MLNIFNNLSPFIEDCYRRFSVREYAKHIKVSPPTASKILKDLHSKTLLKKETFRNFIFFWADKENNIFIELSRIYWKEKFKSSGLAEYIEKSLTTPTVILFGSLSKAETKIDSDIDLAIFGSTKKLNLKIYEKKLKRNIQIFNFPSINKVKNRDLLNNIINGTILIGRLKL